MWTLRCRSSGSCRKCAAQYVLGPVALPDRLDAFPCPIAALTCATIRLPQHATKADMLPVAESCHQQKHAYAVQQQARTGHRGSLGLVASTMFEPLTSSSDSCPDSAWWKHRLSVSSTVEESDTPNAQAFQQKHAMADTLHQCMLPSKLLGWPTNHRHSKVAKS